MSQLRVHIIRVLIPGKGNRYPLDKSPPKGCGRFGEEKNLLLLPGIERQLHRSSKQQCLTYTMSVLKRYPLTKSANRVITCTLTICISYCYITLCYKEYVRNLLQLSDMLTYLVNILLKYCSKFWSRNCRYFVPDNFLQIVLYMCVCVCGCCFCFCFCFFL